jgi:hypothetical protein
MPEFLIAHILVQKILKKTLVSTQNPENKGSEFFLPARSMVLKVVTGKILETLELQDSPSKLRSCVSCQVVKDQGLSCR